MVSNLSKAITSMVGWFSERLNVISKAFASLALINKLEILCEWSIAPAWRLIENVRAVLYFCKLKGLGFKKCGIRSSWCTRFLCQSAVAKSASHPSSRDFWLGESVASGTKQWCEALFFRISKFRKWEGAFGYGKTFEKNYDFKIIFKILWFLEDIFLCLWMKSLQRKLSFNVTNHIYNMILKENQ